MEDIKVNRYQTVITETLLSKYPQEVQDSFKEFVTKTTKVLNAPANLIDDVKNGLQQFCDPGFDNEDDILTYCRDNHIPC